MGAVDAPLQAIHGLRSLSSETTAGTTQTTTYVWLMFLLYITAHIYMVEVYYIVLMHRVVLVSSVVVSWIS